jgi:hypothetical protein
VSEVSWQQQLLDYIGNDPKLHALAANGERFMWEVHPEVEKGSNAFYNGVLKWIRTYENEERRQKSKGNIG